MDGIERCIDDEIPFEIPDSWSWTRFGTAMINRDAERIPLSVGERSKLAKKYDYSEKSVRRIIKESTKKK